MSFKPIETQEQLEEVLKDRLRCERDTVKKDYEGWLSPDDVAERYKDHLSPDDAAVKYKDYLSPDDAKKLRDQIKGYETDSVKMRIAHEVGLDYSAVGFLKGEDEESIRKSADDLRSLIGSSTVAPLASLEPHIGNETDAALKKTLKGLKGE